MKRRDFLSASLSVTGVMASPLAFGDVRPCAPGSLAVVGGTSATSNCVAMSGNGPSWFQAAAPLQWVAVAGQPDATLGAAFDGSQNRSPYAPFSVRRGFVESESGMCVNQDDKELLMVANGGHADGYGNEGYALDLASERPQWRLLSERTPHYTETTGYKGVVVSVRSTDTQTIVDCTGITAPTGSFAPRLARRANGSGDAAFALKFDSGGAARPLALGLVDSFENLGGGAGRFHVTHFTAALKPLDHAPAPGSTFTVVDYLIDENFVNKITSGASLDSVPNDRNSPLVAVYGDGRPRAMHTVNQQWYANGRVWFPFQNSIASGQGASHIGVVSYNRAWVKTQANPVPWRRSGSGPQGLGPWEIHGHVPFDTSPAMATMIFCPANYDPHTNAVWMVAGKSSNSNTYWSVDANTGRTRLYRSGSDWINLGSMWSVMIPGADPSGNGGSVMLVAQRFKQNLYVFRPSLAGTDNAHNAQVATGPALAWGEGDGGGEPGAFSDEWGAVYHAPSRTIIAYNNDQVSTLGRRLRVLRVPFVNGVIDLGGTWAWREIELGGMNPAPIQHRMGLFTKFNIVKDLGGPGVDALVLVTSEDGPTYVCKLPNGPLV